MSVVHCAAFHQSKNATRWSEGKLVITSFLADLSGSGWVGGEGAERERERERETETETETETERERETFDTDTLLFQTKSITVW